MNRLGLLAFAIFAAAAVWGQTNAGPAAMDQPSKPGAGTLRGFSVPEYDLTTGLLKWRMFGDSARVDLTSGKVLVQQMKIEVYRETNLNMTVKSPVCLFDRTAKTAVSDEAVEIVSTNMVVTGKGFEWFSGDNRMNIHNDVTVKITSRNKSLFRPNEPETK